MKLFVAAVLTVFQLVSSNTAQAKDMPLIRLTCESCKGVEIPLGLMVADNNPRVIQAVYYIDEDGSRKNFSTAQLRQMTMVYNYKGYDAAFVSLASNANAGSAALHIRYLRNAIRSTYGEIEFNVRYSAPMNMYQVINPNSDRPISEAYIVPNKFLGKMVGISRIDMR
jgi:hypothetical protein